MENSLAVQSDITKLSLIERKDAVEYLQNKLDQSERDGLTQFENFSDIEMIMWYLYRQRNLNADYDLSEKTVKKYETELLLFIRQLVEFGHEFNLDLIVDSDIGTQSLLKLLDKRHMRRYQQWLAKSSPYVLKKGSYSPATLLRKITIIKSFLKELYEYQYIDKPIHEGFLTVSVRKDDRPNRDAGPNDVMRLLEGFENIGHIPMFTIIQVLTTTGMRNEELCRLKVKDVQVDSIYGGHYITVLGKGNKHRDIPLRDKTLESIHLFRKARALPSIHEADSETPLFTNRFGKPFSPSYFSQYFKKQLEFLPIEYKQHLSNVVITPHLFRHAFAIISNMQSVMLQDIMRSLGHERIETTMIYLEKIFARERHAINQWSEETLGKYF